MVDGLYVCLLVDRSGGMDRLKIRVVGKVRIVLEVEKMVSASLLLSLGDWWRRKGKRVDMCGVLSGGMG